MKRTITCAGIAVCDVVVQTVSHPLPLGLLQLVDDLSLTEGGCALRTARVLGGMGIDTTLVAPVGRDMFGDALKQAMATDNVETLWVEVDEGTSSSAILVDDEGERTIFHSIGANRALTIDHIQSRARGEVLHVGGALVLPALDGEPLGKLLAWAREEGMYTSLDVVYDASNRWDRLEPALPHLDLFCPSLAEAEAITGEPDPSAAASALRAAGVEVVMVTDGANGCWVDSDESRFHLPAFPVDVVDTTGAGDAFTAGALIGVSHGLAPSECARLAAAMGALATTTSAAFAGPTEPEDAWRLAGLEVSKS